MTTQVADVSDFLLRRLDEDEEVALLAAGWDGAGRERVPGNWTRDGVASIHDADAGRNVVYSEGYQVAESDADHMARHDPARVLAQVEAMRAAVVEHEPITLSASQWCSRCDQTRHPGEFDDRRNYEPWPCPTLRALARVYASHPEFDERWSA